MAQAAGPVGKPATYQGIVGLHARLSEINRPGVKKVRCETSYTSVTHWPAWLDMGDRPGELIATGQGVYGTTMAALPRPWVAAARRHRPELLADPVKQLEPLWLKG